MRSDMLGRVPACRLSTADCSSAPPRAGSNRTPHRDNSRLQSFNWGRIISHKLELDRPLFAQSAVERDWPGVRPEWSGVRHPLTYSQSARWRGNE